MTLATFVPYMYRDANNYKSHATIVLSGAMTEEQKEQLRGALEGGETFIPAQLGFEHLGFTEGTWTSFPDEDDDHPWHELDVDDIEVRDLGKAVPKCTVEEFLKMFTDAAAAGWDSVKYDPSDA